MSENDAVRLHDTIDARVWAEEFCRVFGEKIPAIRDERAWVEGWFANAIMVGESHGRSRSDAEEIFAGRYDAGRMA